MFFTFKNSLAPGVSQQHVPKLPGRQESLAPGESRQHAPIRPGRAESGPSAIQTAAESGLETRSRDLRQEVPLFATEGKVSTAFGVSSKSIGNGGQFSRPRTI